MNTVTKQLKDALAEYKRATTEMQKVMDKLDNDEMMDEADIELIEDKEVLAGVNLVGAIIAHIPTREGRLAVQKVYKAMPIKAIEKSVEYAESVLKD